jgi:hypothetical protein
MACWDERVHPKALTDAAAQAALRRSSQRCGLCIVAVDSSSLQLADEFGAKCFGRFVIWDRTRCLIVQTALAMS